MVNLRRSTGDVEDDVVYLQGYVVNDRGVAKDHERPGRLSTLFRSFRRFLVRVLNCSSTLLFRHLLQVGRGFMKISYLHSFSIRQGVRFN